MGLLCGYMGTKREFLEQGPGRVVQSFGFSGPHYLQRLYSGTTQSNDTQTGGGPIEFLEFYYCALGHIYSYVRLHADNGP